MAFNTYPRNLAGFLVVGLCLFMAVFMFQANRWISLALVCLAVFRAVVIVKDMRRQRGEAARPADPAPVGSADPGRGEGPDL